MRIKIEMIIMKDDDEDGISDQKDDKEKVNEERDRKGVNDDAVELLKSSPVLNKITNDD